MAEENTFKRGDVVILNSGSPGMTVQYAEDGQSPVYCIFYDETAGTFIGREFYADMLTKVDTTPSEPDGVL